MARRNKMMRGLDWAVRAGIAGLFFYAGALKLRDPAQFASEIENYRLVSAGVAILVGHYLPWVEIVAGAALLGKPLRLSGWLITVLLASGFTLFVGSAWARGLDISCGCFGSSSTAVGWVAMLRAGGILVLAIAGTFYEMRQITAARSTPV